MWIRMWIAANRNVPQNMEQTRYAVNMLKGQTATQMNLDWIKE